MSVDALQVLLVEDDPKVAHTIYESLREKGLRAIRCGTGGEAIESFNSTRIDIVILDLGLPDMDGMDVLQHLRSKSPHIPVLILTARDSVDDRITGLDGGADDYLIKPVALAELQARVRALVRRVELGRESALQYEDLELNVTDRTAARAGQSLDLTPREFDLLHYFLEHQGEVITRSMLSRDVWKYTSRVTPIDNIIDVQISRLRDKVDKPYSSALVKTVRGVGFTMGGQS